MLNPVEARSPSGGRTPLAQWLAQTLKQRGMHVKFQLRGNHLLLLCEGSPCPNRAIVLAHLIPALKHTDINTLIPSSAPPLYQVLLYGRVPEQVQPEWTATVHLHEIDRHIEHLRQTQAVQPELVGVSRSSPGKPPDLGASAAIVLSNRTQARRGDPHSVARYLSETLSALGVAVQVSVKTVPYAAKSSQAPALRRLWITCEASYSPDPSIIAEPIAQQLRDLELEGCRDALIRVQVTGEAQPDWLLRVDLTPTREMLRDWARWGDVGAIARLLTQALADRGVRLDTTTLKESTLHLCCSAAAGKDAPDRPAVVQGVESLLEQLAPQGIHAAALYGQTPGKETPDWVEWLNLPAKQHPALADSALTLAQQGDREAIAFLLNRLLNPDLDRQLATGGIRLQLLMRQDLMHIMTDAPTCPTQRQVCPIAVRFLKSLKLPHVTGVRIYGRRAGQKRPLWSYGADFAARERLVPEATPEFAATDAYVGDLISRPDDIILRPDLTPADLQTAWTKWRDRTLERWRQMLLRSQIFAPAATDPAPAASPQGAWTAVVWGMVGVLLVVQADWLTGRVLQSIALPAAAEPSVPVAPPAPSPFPTLTLRQSPIEETAAFPNEGFTAAVEPAQVAPSRPLISSDYPTFNSQQLDEKIALYSQQIAEVGPPDVLIVGSSRALRGVDPAALQAALAELGYPNVSVFNFGVNGATAQVVDLILQQILTPSQLPRLIVWADGARAFNSGGVDVTYNGIVVSEGYRKLASGSALPIPDLPSDGTATDLPTAGVGASLTASYQQLDRWLSDRLASVSSLYAERDRVKSLLQAGVTRHMPQAQPFVNAENSDNPASSPSLPSEGQGLIDSQGFLPLSIRFNPATYYQQYARVAGEYDSDYESFQIEGKQAIALDSLLQFTRAQNIPVVFVNLPLTQDYLDPVRLQYEQVFKQYMLRLSVNQQGLIFRDLGELWLDQPDYFSDPSHLNRYGAREISDRLAQDAMIPWADASGFAQP